MTILKGHRMSELDLNSVIEEKALIEKMHPKDTVYEVKHFGTTVEWTKAYKQAEWVFNSLKGEKKFYRITSGKKELINASYLA